MVYGVTFGSQKWRPFRVLVLLRTTMAGQVPEDHPDIEGIRAHVEQELSEAARAARGPGRRTTVQIQHRILFS